MPEQVSAAEAEAKHAEYVKARYPECVCYESTGWVFLSRDRDSPSFPCWRKAALFTWQREQEIAEYMVSRDWLAEFALDGDDAEAVPPLLRLVNEKLAELQRGMKGAQG